MYDNEVKVFRDCAAMTEYITKTYDDTKLAEVKLKELEFIGCNTISDMTWNSTPADKDTLLKGTKLFLSYKDEKQEVVRYGLRECSLSSVHARIGINGQSLYKMTPATAAVVMNAAAQVADQKILRGRVRESELMEYAKLLIVDGKVSAMLSSGEGGNKYAFRNTDNLILDLQDAIYQMTEDVTRFYGRYSYSYVSCDWLTTKEVQMDGEKYYVQLELLTSDIGLSAVTLGASLVNAENVLPVIDDVRVIHKQAISMFDLTSAIETVLNSITHRVTEMEALKEIPIQYPRTCMQRVARACKLPKKEVETLTGTYMVKGPVTAFDCFMRLSEMKKNYIPKDNNARYEKVLKGNLNKMLTVNWAHYDLPTF